MGTLYVVATPIGNLSDVSSRVLSTLKEVDLILAEDTRHTIKLLNHYEIKNKMIAYHKFNEKGKSNSVLIDLKNGKNVALVSDAGTPCISDPGYVIVKLAREAGINVIGVSGPSAVITALSVSGFDISSFSFYGFLPKENNKKRKLLEQIQKSDVKTFVIYESPKRILKTARELELYFPTANACFCCDLTKLHEASTWGKLSEVVKVLEANSKSELGEYTIVIEKEVLVQEKEEEYTLEALLINEIVKNNTNMKEAIKLVSTRYKKNKNRVYEASLKIKNIDI